MACWEVILWRVREESCSGFRRKLVASMRRRWATSRQEGNDECSRALVEGEGWNRLGWVSSKRGNKGGNLIAKGGAQPVWARSRKRAGID